MPKEEIIDMVLEMYNARKEAKEYLEFFASPDEDGKLEEYKKIITEEFYPSKGRQEPKTRFAVCRKAVSDYKKFKPSADKLADLMLCYVENACQFTYDYGDMWEQYYTSVENNFDKTMAFIAKNNMLEQFKHVGVHHKNEHIASELDLEFEIATVGEFKPYLFLFFFVGLLEVGEDFSCSGSEKVKGFFGGLIYLLFQVGFGED